MSLKKKKIMGSVSKLDNDFKAYHDANNLDYLRIRKFAENKGIKIINVGRGGKLEAFKRTDLDVYFTSNSR